MTNQELLIKIRTLMGMEVKPVQVTVELMSDKLQDGTEIQYDTYEVGSKIEVLQEDGTYLPAPIGTHILENGDTVNVIEEGIIGEIIPATEMAEVIEPTDPEITEDPIPEVPTLEGVNAQVMELNTRLEELESIIELLVSSYDMSKQTITELSTQIKGIAISPAIAPVFVQNTDTVADIISTRFANLDQLKKNK